MSMTSKKYQVLGGFPSGLPDVTSNDNGKILQVVDGQWVVTTIDEVRESIIDNFIVIGSEEPTTKCLWFDTGAVKEETEELVLMFSLDNVDSADVQAEAEGIEYAVVNATVDEEPTETTYNFDII